MELGLQNKNALVCGSTQGIGRATAISLAKEGVNITLMARNEKALKEVLYLSLIHISEPTRPY